MSRPMKRQKQKLGHKPSEDIWGDCYRTAVAVVLGLSAEEVPHFCNGQWLDGDPSGIVAARDWLKQFGLGVFTIPYPPDISFEDVMRTMRHCNPDVPVLLTGMGARDVNHVVVTQGGEIICDPATGKPTDQCLLGPAVNDDGEAYWWVEVICLQPEGGTWAQT